MALPGVGRKTANLVLILAFRSRAQHLRRYPRAPHLEPSRLGARRRMPEETEQALYRATERDGGRTSTCIWSRGARTSAGRSIPRCGDCVIAPECPRIGVGNRPELGWSSCRRKCDHGGMIDARCIGVARCRRRSLVEVATAPGGTRPRRRPAAASGEAGDAGAGPVLVVETAKGMFEIETYPNEAPKTVEHILALVKRNFYNGLRVHRVVPGFVVQFGDPQTRDMTKRDVGHGGSGKPIGVGGDTKRHAPASARSRWHTRATPASRQPDVHHVRAAAAASTSDLHGIRPGDLRHGRRRRSCRTDIIKTSQP